MEERNPLDISTSSQYKLSELNRRGRPKLSKIVKFSAEPKSLLISQLLNKNRIEIVHTNIAHTSETSENVDETRYTACLGAAEEKVSKFQRSISMKIDGMQQKTIEYSCEFPSCSYKCKLHCNLIKHKRIHTDEKPYLCDKCNFKSKFSNSLRAHQRIHTDERPHACKYCSYKCNSSSNLKKHCLHRHPELNKT